MLAARGSDVILQRGVGQNQAWLSVKCRAQVLGYQVKDLSTTPGAGIQLGDSRVIMSPTQINEAQWPGGYVPGPTTQGDQRVPKGNQDRLIIQGKTRQVIAGIPTYLGGTLVRLDLVVR